MRGADEERDDHVVDDIGCGVDAIREQCRGMSHNTNRGFGNSQNNVDYQREQNRLIALAVALFRGEVLSFSRASSIMI